MGRRSRRQRPDGRVHHLLRAEPAGGSVELGELIEQHGPALLYDLRTVGVDLRDLWRPDTGVTPRLVLWLAGQLPPESAFHAALRGGPEQRPWTTTGHLLAGVVNLLYAANKQRAGKRVGSLPVRPPAGAKAKRAARTVSVAEIAARQNELDDRTTSLGGFGYQELR